MQPLVCYAKLVIMALLDRYKKAGANFTDQRGTLDVTEFVNIAKDDALAWPAPARRTYPSAVNARMESTIKPFVEKSLAVNKLLIDALNDKLGLPKGTFADLHKPEAFSGCTARVIRAPPLVEPEKLVLSAHTDSGSLVRVDMAVCALHLYRSVLFRSVVPTQSSRRLASSPSWLRQMVLREGLSPFDMSLMSPSALLHALMGFGFVRSPCRDTRFVTSVTHSIFSAAACCAQTSTASCACPPSLRSFSCHPLLIHRRPNRPPPENQGQYERWSVVFFTRPDDAATLRHLSEKSATIAAAVARAPPGRYEPGVTAPEWLKRKFRNVRATHYKVRSTS